MPDTDFLQTVRARISDGARRYGLTPLRQASEAINADVDAVLPSNQSQFQVACKPGCDHCCHRPVPLTNLEAALIADAVSCLEPSVLKQVTDRFSSYRETTRWQRADPPLMMRVPCPLIHEHRCLVYERRPLACRAQASPDADVCRNWKDSPQWGVNLPDFPSGTHALAEAIGATQMEGLVAGGGDPRMLELGLAVDHLLKNPDLIQIVARDGFAIPDADWRIGMRQVAGEPPGEAELTPKISEEVDILLRWKPQAKSLLPDKGMSALEALMLVQTPIAYDSEDQLLDSRERYRVVLDRIDEMSFDSREVFDASGRHGVQTLTAQGMNDRDLAFKLGSFLTRHTQNVFPDLSAPIEPRKAASKLRVGFLGATLTNHQGGRWALGYLLRKPEDVEVYALHLAEKYDRYTEMWRQRSDHFHQLLGTIQEVARFVKSLNLDVIVFCGPHSDMVSKQIACFRMAPLQLTTWGTPHTLGFPEVDHYLSCECMEPSNGQDHYSERLTILPGWHLCYERSHIVEATPLDISKLGPGPWGLIAQIPNKLLPRRDDLFRRVADELGNPLLLVDYDDVATEVVRRRFQRNGVPIQWINPMPPDQFRGLMGAVDVCLDTADWNGGNTTLETWLAGTPVVTMPGPLMRGRHTLGFLKLLGAENMAANDEEEYVSHVKDRVALRERTRQLPIESLFENHAATDTFFGTLRTLLEAAR